MRDGLWGVRLNFVFERLWSFAVAHGVQILVYVTWLFSKRVQKLFEKEEAMHFFLCLKEKSSKKEANEHAARPLADKST